jgi:hypothetical protein
LAGIAAKWSPAAYALPNGVAGLSGAWRNARVLLFSSTPEFPWPAYDLQRRQTMI